MYCRGMKYGYEDYKKKKKTSMEPRVDLGVNGYILTSSFRKQLYFTHLSQRLMQGITLKLKPECIS
jgi:hypothetical protein